MLTNSSASQRFFPKKRVKLERDLDKGARDWTMDEVWTSFPSWIKLMMKEEKSLKEGLEKLSLNQDNIFWISCLAFLSPIGCPPFWLKLKSCVFSQL
ncbi:MAG: hypothetical protein A3J72_01465 [Nitrospirae bacterium RIFCSPHIGHO2_02_FULL_40_19]|nr:MAG: hypothetical protein A3J72_01465 [Nitrospirae bacterium RIFCSPHIGHO2_02_FULL_40_19]